MTLIRNIVNSPIKEHNGALRRSSGYEYRDFWYTTPAGQRINVKGWHRAVDIVTLGTVIAVERGKVVSVTKHVTGVTTNPASGNQVTLEHGNGNRTNYSHLDFKSIPTEVFVGAIIEKGSTLGTTIVRTTGNSTGRHLHFSLFDKKANMHIDPTPYLQGKFLLMPFSGDKQFEKYKVKRGDFLSTIGTMFGVPWQDIYEINKITIGRNPDRIREGQELRIPVKSNIVAPRTHRIQRGESLSIIARKYNTTWRKIYTDNKEIIGDNPDIITTGDTLIIR